MASSLNLLKSYGSDNESESSIDSGSEEKQTEIVVDPLLSLKSSIMIDAAPMVLYSVS